MEKGKTLSAKRLGVAVGLALGAYLSLLALTAWLTVSGRLAEEMTENAVRVCAGIASFAGALAASRGQHGAALPPLLACGAFWAITVLLGLLAGKGIDLHGAAVMLVAIGLGVLLSLLLTRRGKGKRKRRRSVSGVRR